MPFFGVNPPAWTDMSNYVVHFTKTFDGKDPYWNMMGIMSQRRIRALSAFGIGRKHAPDENTQKASCFSEVPLDRLGRIADKRSRYGIVFHKDFVLARHANPILYAYKDGQLYQSIDTKDVVCLIIPTELHDAAREWFEEVRRENLGPVYDCPFIDPYWTKKEIDLALKPKKKKK